MKPGKPEMLKINSFAESMIPSTDEARKQIMNSRPIPMFIFPFYWDTYNAGIVLVALNIVSMSEKFMERKHPKLMEEGSFLPALLFPAWFSTTWAQICE